MYKVGQRIARKVKVDDHPFRGERYGKPWRKDELLHLEGLYHRGVTVLNMCHIMERPAAGILAKLALMRLISFNTADYSYYAAKDSNHEFAAVAVADEVVKPNIEVQTQGEVEMSNNIETVVMICGVNASTKTDDEIFDLIRKLEVNMESLERISNKPNKLRAKITQIKADIDALVSYVDSRETEPVVPAVKPTGISPSKF